MDPFPVRLCQPACMQTSQTMKKRDKNLLSVLDATTARFPANSCVIYE